MRNPHRARVCERQFLNLPGYHAGAYVRAYVEDTSDLPGEYDGRPLNYYARLELEIADCARRIALEFDITTAGERMNSFYKLDMLIAALQAFREGMVEEAALYRARAVAVEEDRRVRAENAAMEGGVRQRQAQGRRAPRRLRAPRHGVRRLSSRTPRRD